MPFLLPLLLQVGFGLTPFQSGLITFASTLGALCMKAAAPRMLKRFGFRTVLIWNAILSATLHRRLRRLHRDDAVSGHDRRAAGRRLLPLAAIHRRSTRIAYAEVRAARMSRATALVSVGQQVSLSTGVAVGALTVEMAVRMNGQATIMASDFPPGFLLVGIIAAASALIFWLLPPNAGAEMANRVPAASGTSDQRMG